MTNEQAAEMLNLLKQIAENTQRKPKAGTAQPKLGKHKYGEYKNVMLTDDEHKRLQGVYGASLEAAIRYLDEAIELKGYTYKSHYLLMCKQGSWVKDAILGAQQQSTTTTELF